MLTTLGLSAVLIGLLGPVAQNAAQAAPAGQLAQTTASKPTVITGKLGITGATKSGTIRKSDLYLYVYTGNCGSVDYQKLTISKNRYTVWLDKPGTYKVTFNTRVWSEKTPYGSTTPTCSEKTKAVKAKAGKTVTLDVKGTAFGALRAYGKLEGQETFGLYDSKGTRLVKRLYEYDDEAEYRTEFWPLKPGTYKLVKFDRKTDKVTAVFGTSSKQPAKGKSITITSSKALKVLFDRGITGYVKSFSLFAQVEISGTAEPGNTLTAKATGFPKGVTVKYQWYRSPCFGFDEDDSPIAIPDARSAKYLVEEADRCAYLSVATTVSKKGYLTKFGGAYEYIGGPSLTQVTAHEFAGLTLEGRDYLARPGETVTYTPATFEQDGVEVTYEWVYWYYDDSYTRHKTVVSTSSTFTPDDTNLAGERNFGDLTVKYTKVGYLPELRRVHFNIVP